MPAIDFFYKTINDPIHGSIRLSRAEIKVIETPSFQRLRSLKQLGLADFVFPGATHSRFAHSLGVLHIVSRMIESVEMNHRRRNPRKKDALFSDLEKQKIRLAALLHDVGHFPLSHAMEQPIQRIRWEKGDMVEKKGGADQHLFGALDATAQADCDEGFGHEEYGMLLLAERKDLQKALKDYNKDNEIGKIFTGAHTEGDTDQSGVNRFSQFIKGTLDADRLDFLIRDSVSSGFSFGNIDLDYLLENLFIDTSDYGIVVDYKGINALEHYITARYFSYNVTYHKTVMGFELLAKHAYYQMTESGMSDLPATEDDLRRMAKDDKRFPQLTDEFFWTKLRDWNAKGIDKAVKISLFERKPLRLLFEERVLVDLSELEQKKTFNHLEDNNRFAGHDKFKSMVKKRRLAPGRMAVLTRSIKFEKYATSVRRGENLRDHEVRQLSRVLFNDSPRPLVDTQSIIGILANYELRIRRLYFIDDPSRPRIDRKGIRRDLLRALE